MSPSTTDYFTLQLRRRTLRLNRKELVKHVMRIILPLQLLQLRVAVAEYVFGQFVVLL